MYSTNLLINYYFVFSRILGNLYFLLRVYNKHKHSNLMSFTREALKTLKQSGTVAPSSKFLIAKMIKDVDFNNAKVILEYGMGDGCITEAIIKNKKDETVLIGLEINDAFFKLCEQKFSKAKNVFLLKESATEIDKILLDHKITKADYVISSLPLTLIDDKISMKILLKTKQVMTDSALYVQYQYSLSKYRLLKKMFGKVKIDFTAKNIPPAFIYRCVK